MNVGAPPYYGPDTRFYGEDAKALGLPLVKRCGFRSSEEGAYDA